MKRAVRIPIGTFHLEGALDLPASASGLVVFAHGSGSSRLSPRNRFVAIQLRDAGFGTLLFDLLTPEEDEVYENRFDIERLAERLEAASQWAIAEAGPLALGFFGASTGAAAALCAAARMGDAVGAVVSRGGRPDLAGEALTQVRAPTLLIVGELDREVLALNRRALERLPCAKNLSIVPGATHLFEEPGTLAEAARRAAGWFGRHLAPGPRRTAAG